MEPNCHNEEQVQFEMHQNIIWQCPILLLPFPFNYISLEYLSICLTDSRTHVQSTLATWYSQAGKYPGHLTRGAA